LTHDDAWSSLEMVESWCKPHKDPVVAVYLPDQSNQAQRNFVFRSLIYCANNMGEGKSALNLPEVDAAVGAMGTVEPDNHSPEDPFKMRFSGPRALWKFYGYIQAMKHLHWPAGDAANPKFFLAVDPFLDYHPVV
jgi:hypothetical protein